MSQLMLTGAGRRFETSGGAFVPTDLFASGEDGYLLIADPAYCFQERTGASATTACGNGDPVGTWVDSSGNGYYYVAAVDATRPILRQDGSAWYIDFGTTSGDFLTGTAYSTQTVAGVSLGIAARPAALGSQSVAEFIIGDANGKGMRYNGTTNSQANGVSVNALSTASVLSGNTTVADKTGIATINGTTLELWVNNSSAGTSTANGTAWAFYEIGRRPDVTTLTFAGRLYAVVVSDAVWDGTDRTNLHTYLDGLFP